jgi:exo-beta-1,3-glucanase (GH17 family)
MYKLAWQCNRLFYWNLHIDNSELQISNALSDINRLISVNDDNNSMIYIFENIIDGKTAIPKLKHFTHIVAINASDCNTYNTVNKFKNIKGVRLSSEISTKDIPEEISEIINTEC